MNERTKGILGAIVILGCFALLGYLVHERVDGATVAAISTVTILVAWFTQSTGRKDPPSGAAVVAGIATVIVALAACSSPQEKALAAEQAYREQQRDCLRQYTSPEHRRACVTRVREDWGGFVEVETDGGAR